VLLDAKARAIAYAPDAAHIGKRRNCNWNCNWNWIGTGLALDWHWIGTGLALDWHWIGTGLELHALSQHLTSTLFSSVFFVVFFVVFFAQPLGCTVVEWRFTTVI
jgi:hypothetical protein